MKMPVFENEEERSRQEYQFQCRCYEKYKLDWMLRHGHSLETFVDCMNDLNKDVHTEDIKKLYKNWTEDCGFFGSCFCYFSEFLECEYQNADYMKQLLNQPEFEFYQYMQNLTTFPLLDE